MSGRVVLLLGPSSVGKTAVARRLQATLFGIWLLAGVDLFWAMLKESTLPEGGFRTDSDAMRRITRGWHRAVAALAREGNDLLVDDLLVHSRWLDDWREALSGVRWWSVLLKASPEVLSERERGRGDRPPGLAASDRARSPVEGRFDLVIDTEQIPVSACALTIQRFLSESGSSSSLESAHPVIEEHT